MKKGLTQTLMAVAVITLAVQAMAMAPVIGDVPSPVVGDMSQATDTNLFVFPDAIKLSDYVTDDNTTNTSIVWSYGIESSQGTAKYAINGLAPLGATEDPIAPPAGKIIAGPGATNTDPNKGSDASKITVRNIALSPIGGQNAAEQGTSGVLANQTQMVTLYASDGTTMSFTGVYFYSSNNTDDSLSPSKVIDYQTDFSTDTDGFGVYSTPSGQLTTSYDSTKKAVCMTTAAAGNNMGVWSGPYGMLPLVQNAIYRVRAVVNGSQTNANECPFWDLIINNFGYDASHTLKGMNLYGANYMFFDNTGSANAALAPRGDVNFDMWWCPSPVKTTQWNDTSETKAGPFAASNAGNRDAFIEFRILDVATNDGGGDTGIHASQGQGTLCLKSLTVERYDWSQMTVVGQPLYNAATLTQGGLNGATTGTGNTRVDGMGSATVDFSGGAVTVTPTNASKMLATVEPGDYTYDAPNWYTDSTKWTDNYPCPMEPQTLYLATFGMSAPNQTSEDNPPDIFWVGNDSLTNELINLSYVSVQGWHHGMPKQGTAQNYHALFFSNYATKTTGTGANPAWFSAFRPRFMMGNDPGLGGGGEANTGAIRISSMKVEKVTVQ